MSLGLFKKTYTIRQHAPQTITRGYASSPWTETLVKLNVQPLTPDELQALPEGERTIKRVKAFGTDKLISADEFTGTPGDCLFYNGYWYECKSSVMWDHTMLKHYRSEFVILPQKEQESPPEEATAP